jgi:hypothetical protein
MTEFDISGWVPQWAQGRDHVSGQRTNLLALHGHRIIDSWLVWDLQHDKWFADLPVVLVLDHGRQLEVCWKNLDILSITWNTIDVSTTPIAWVTWPLAWRSQGHESLRAVTGQTITLAAFTEYRFTTRQLLPPTNELRSTWLVAGIWLETHDGGLHIFNALDENGLSSSAPIVGEDHRLLAV